jgi:thiamine biosynthesis lipoprotein
MFEKPFTTETQRHRENQANPKSGKRKSLPLFFLCVSVSLWWILTLTACSKPAPIYQEQAYVFGTLVDVSVYGADETHARLGVAAVLKEFQRMHNLYHAWQPSELSELNAALALGKSHAVSSELAAMLKNATQLSAQADGLFNPAIGGLIQAWGFQADDFATVLPEEKIIAALVKGNPQMGDITLSPNPSPASGRGETAISRNRAVKLDLGGYAKGFALDRAAEILKQNGIQNALVNIGGNVLALGKHGDRPWRVGIQHPRQPGPIATLELRDGEAIGTSGDYQRYFELDGKRYCHVIDPRSGHPVQGVQAVTILTHGARAGLLSDASSKPLFISGAAGWRAAAGKMSLDEALLIDAEGVVHLTAAMQKRLEFTDSKTRYRIEP